MASDLSGNDVVATSSQSGIVGSEILGSHPMQRSTVKLQAEPDRGDSKLLSSYSITCDEDTTIQLPPTLAFRSIKEACRKLVPNRTLAVEHEPLQKDDPVMFRI